MDRKLKVLTQQMSDVSKKEGINLKEINEIKIELNRYKGLYENQLSTFNKLDTKFKNKTNELTQLKTKLTILEKQIDNKDDKTTIKYRDLFIKILHLDKYKYFYNNLYNTYILDDITKHFKDDLSNEECKLLFE